MKIDKDKWRFYGRRVGRKLNKTRKIVLDTLYPRLQIKGEDLDEAGTLAPSSLFKSHLKKIVLEIGFGNGEHLAEMMRRAPEAGFIGAEPFSNGMTSFLKEIEEDGLEEQNIRVLMDDAIPLVRSLTPQSVDEIYILNPDPWHKKRHHSRRIINSRNLDEFSRILKPHGKLIMSTDVRDLIEWMVTHASRHPHFKWQANHADDWRVPPADWIPTRYETKGAKGADKMNYLFFEKIEGVEHG